MEPAHTGDRRRAVILFGSFLPDKDIDKERTHVCDQCAGRRMKSGRFCKIIKRQAKNRNRSG